VRNDALLQIQEVESKLSHRPPTSRYENIAFKAHLFVIKASI